MKKLTAVEFMVEELDKSIGLTKFVDTCDEDYKQEILGIINQTKEMDIRQKIEFGKKIADHWGMVTVPIESIEQYYNETYKSK